jgi:scyllo-inositol 2-dehydrogenase (NADP+)
MPLMIDTEPVRFGIAGLGRAGSFHAERLGLREDSRVVAAYDDCQSALDRAPAVSQNTSTDWHDFLGDERIEGVLLATPPAAHAELAIASLAAGKHVLVETPLCLHVYEADAIAAAAARSGKQVFVCQTRSWNDDFRMARQVLDTGELGKLLSIKSIHWQYSPFATGTNSVTNGVPATSAAPVCEWRRHAATGGGLLWEAGIHDFDQLLQLVDRAPESVYGRLIPSLHGECDEGFLAVVNFPEGLTAHVEASRVASAPLATGWVISGSLGSYGGFTQYTPTAEGEVVDVPLNRMSANPDDLYRQVVQCVRQGAANPTPLPQARATIALIEAIRTSARTGKPVTLA